MKDLTVIIPLHEYIEEISDTENFAKCTSELLLKAIDSVHKADTNGETKLIISTTEDIANRVMEQLNIANEVAFVYSEKTSEAALINKAVKEVTTKYFSVLEFDDEYTEKWFNIAQRYIGSCFEASFYLPLTEVFDFKSDVNAPIGYANEATWASSFSEKIGYYDIESLQTYFNFLCSGGIFNTNDFNEIGGLKESIKLVFWYEFLLRAIKFKKDVFVIPKIGYHHFVNRDGSLSSIYAETISQEEGDWWVELANKEYMFKNDRNKTYEE